MNKEEKAKAYDEALERARKIKEGKDGWNYSNHYEINPVLEEIFPQLRESEDERIRKKILELVRKHSVNHERCMMEGWLEKQKEQKELPLMNGNADLYFDEWNQQNSNPTKRQCFEEGMKYAQRLQKEQKPERINITEMVAKYRVTDEYIEGEHIGKPVNCMIRAYEQGIRDTLLKVKEQKPVEWSEDWREEDIQMRFAFYTYKDDLSVLYLSNVFVEETSRNHGFGTRILKAAEKVAEAIGAITIRLKVKQDSPANAWYRKHGYGHVAFEDGYDWLEKNLKNLKPAKSTEWSEEDERMLQTAIEACEAVANDYKKSSARFYKCKDWLKNRLKSLNLQPKVKWNKEDEERYLSCLQRLGTGNPTQPETINSKWFKEHVYQQPHWKSSEEDEKMLDSIIRIITHFDDLAHEPTFAGPKWTHPYTKELNWLKSLRASWKPSEEQMRGLKYFLDYHRPQRNAGTTVWKEFDAVDSLYDDLKKL